MTLLTTWPLTWLTKSWREVSHIGFFTTSSLRYSVFKITMFYTDSSVTCFNSLSFYLGLCILYSIALKDLSHSPPRNAWHNSIMILNCMVGLWFEILWMLYYTLEYWAWGLIYLKYSDFSVSIIQSMVEGLYELKSTCLPLSVCTCYQSQWDMWTIFESILGVGGGGWGYLDVNFVSSNLR